ncbi:MAG: acyl-CoA dehydrogenase family protein, partial [Chloroflexi bacterium]
MPTTTFSPITLSDEQIMLRDAVREFAEREIVPIAAHHDETGEFPLATVKKMGEMGLMGIEVPEEFGGAGMDTVAYVLAMIEIAKADAAHSTVMAVNGSLFGYALMKFGTPEQKRCFL